MANNSIFCIQISFRSSRTHIFSPHDIQQGDILSYELISRSLRLVLQLRKQRDVTIAHVLGHDAHDSISVPSIRVDGAGTIPGQPIFIPRRAEPPDAIWRYSPPSVSATAPSEQRRKI